MKVTMILTTPRPSIHSALNPRLDYAGLIQVALGGFRGARGSDSRSPGGFRV